jgi:hypothetical protein
VRHRLKEVLQGQQEKAQVGLAGATPADPGSPLPALVTAARWWGNATNRCWRPVWWPTRTEHKLLRHGPRRLRRGHRWGGEQSALEALAAGRV